MTLEMNLKTQAQPWAPERVLSAFWAPLRGRVRWLGRIKRISACDVLNLQWACGDVAPS